MTIISAYKLDAGRQREQNEDYVWIDEQAGLYIVADGMGGHEAGEVASQLASVTIGEYVSNRIMDMKKPLSVESIKKLMAKAIEIANETVNDAASAAEQTRRMGATIVVTFVQLPFAYISHAGDSRAYLIRDSAIKQLTEDDSWGMQFASATDTNSDNDVTVGRYDHILTKAIGQDSIVDPSFTTVEIMPGDWLLMCSDGLWNMVNDEQILAKLQKSDNDPQQAVEILVDSANEAGGKDNISIVIIKIL